MECSHPRTFMANQPQEALLSIQSDRYKAEYAYVAWLSRCCIMNGNPHFAWELYLQVHQFIHPPTQLKQSSASPTNPTHLTSRQFEASAAATLPPQQAPAAFTALLTLLATDCYRMGHFLYAAKAFEVLERLEPNEPEHWEGKRGACVGVFQMVRAVRALGSWSGGWFDILCGMIWMGLTFTYWVSTPYTTRFCRCWRRRRARRSCTR